MALLTKKDIFKVNDLPQETVAVEEWGGEVIVRGLTAKGRDEFEQLMYDQLENRTTDSVRTQLIIRCCVDENGDLLFGENDVKRLQSKSGVAVNRVFKVAQRLSGLTAKDVEEISKN